MASGNGPRLEPQGQQGEALRTRDRGSRTGGVRHADGLRKWWGLATMYVTQVSSVEDASKRATDTAAWRCRSQEMSFVLVKE